VDGKIVCVRLALFAEMMKGRAWTPAALKQVGGAEGVGATFLEETFSAATASPTHRYHQKAARAMLKALLPEAGSDIKGHLRPRDELLAVSEYGSRPGDFEELLHILDAELRLITPTDPEGVDSDTPVRSASEGGGRYYQLTHDYLVPSLREWLTRKQKQTRRGRAELRLADRATLWSARPESRLLPAWWEWLNILLYTRKRDWTALQRKMMRQAGRYHRRRGLLLAVCLLLAGWGCWEGVGWLEARSLRHRLLEASTVEVPGIVEAMKPYRRWLDGPLREEYAQAQTSGDTRKQLHVSMALLPVDGGQIDYLQGRLLQATAEPQEVLAMRQMLYPYRDSVSAALWEVLQDRKKLGAERLRAACALAAYGEEDGRWEKVRADVVAALVAQNALEMGRWAEALQPVRQQLLPPLADVLIEDGRDAGQRRTVARIYAGYAADQPEAFAPLEKVLAEKPQGIDEDKLKLARKQANAAAALAAIGRWDRVRPLMQHSPDPTVRSYLIDRLAGLVEARSVLGELERGPELSMRRALLLALGDFDKDRLPPAERELLIPRLVELCRDEDAGIHATAVWLVQQWGQAEKVQQIDRELMGKAEGKRQWYVNGQGQTMVILPSGEFWMGEGNQRQRRRIEHRFALAAREVTVAEFLSFRKAYQGVQQWAPTKDCPATTLSWYDAAAYCNWLSEMEKIDKKEWCYLPNDKGEYGPGMKVAGNFKGLKGYRLPTEEEWEYACRAGSETAWAHGDAEDLLGNYAWYFANSSSRSHPVGSLRPNDWGLFDMHGNAWEWCHDRWQEKPSKELEAKEDIKGIQDKDIRLLRGSSFYYGVLQNARCADRNRSGPAYLYSNFGFRPARTYP
jgi:formylglycine-generating enzyme required for sulfatase activity